MIQRLDQENYSVGETITIKMPFTLPYQMDGKEFERVNGEFEYNGEYFKLVKQRVDRDTLYIVCIKDHNEKKLFNFIADIVKISTDLPTSPQQTMKLLGSLAKDYMPMAPVEMVTQQGWSLKYGYAPQHFNLLVKDFPVFSPPPDFIG